MHFYNKLISDEKVKTEPTIKQELIKKEVKEEIIIDDASDDDICIGKYLSLCWLSHVSHLTDKCEIVNISAKV